MYTEKFQSLKSDLSVRITPTRGYGDTDVLSCTRYTNSTDGFKSTVYEEKKTNGNVLKKKTVRDGSVRGRLNYFGRFAVSCLASSLRPQRSEVDSRNVLKPVHAGDYRRVAFADNIYISVRESKEESVTR